MERSISSCVFPGCRDSDGNPRLTRDVICDSSRAHYRRLLEWVAWDYVTLRVTMPKPVALGPKIRVSSERTYGHPAEWASDRLAEIAAILNTAEDDLRGWLHHDPAVPPTVAESRRVALALHYLTAWFDDLCVFPSAERVATELDDVHRGIRSALGHGRRETYLPVDCPNPSCTRRALVRYLGDDEDHVECLACGESIKADRYTWYTRVLVDEATDPLEIEGVA